MEKIKVAIVGYGNIGKYTLEAVQAAADMECVGIVRRSGADNKPAELANIPVVKDIAELKGVQVAILATPTRKVEEYAKKCLALGINTVDSFDIHTQIVDLRRSLDKVAKANNAVSVISAGWDPGSDSIVRSLIEGLAPKGMKPEDRICLNAEEAAEFVKKVTGLSFLTEFASQTSQCQARE